MLQEEMEAVGGGVDDDDDDDDDDGDGQYEGMETIITYVTMTTYITQRDIQEELFEIIGLEHYWTIDEMDTIPAMMELIEIIKKFKPGDFLSMLIGALFKKGFLINTGWRETQDPFSSLLIEARANITKIRRLMDAVIEGDAQNVEELLSRYPIQQHIEHIRRRACCLALEKYNLSLGQRLYHPDRHIIHREKTRELFTTAIQSEFLDGIEYLVAQGLQGEHIYSRSWSVLDISVKCNSLIVTRYFLTHHAKLNLDLTSPVPLIKANTLEMLRILLNNETIRQNINQETSYGKTALTEQILKSSTQAECMSRVQLLIDAGASVDGIINGLSNDEWLKIVSKKWIEVFNYLIDQLTDINITIRKNQNILYVILRYDTRYPMKDNILYFVKDVVERGVDIYLKDRNGYSPLILASGAGYFDVVKYLLRRGVDVNNKKGKTALIEACRGGHKEIVEYLIQNSGADVNIVNNDGQTALMEACREGHEEIVEYLIQNRGADGNMVNKYGWTALMMACREGHKEIAEYLIQNGGADVNMVNNDGETALMIACWYGYKEIAIGLIQNRRADVNISDKKGKTAIGNLVEQRRHLGYTRHTMYKRQPMEYLPLFKLLLKGGADLTFNGVRLIHVILNEKLKEWFLCLIGLKPHIGGLTKEGENILHLLARLNLNCTPDNFDWLLDYKVDINHKNSNTDSPLMIAAVLLNVKYLKVFTHHSAVDINIQNNNGHTALHCLILGFAKFFQRIPPSQGDNYIQFLSQHLYPSYMECVDILLGAGIDVNIQDNEGKTVLMMAARENDKQLIRKLLDAGAMVDKVDNSDRYALHYLDISDSVYDLTVFLFLLPSGRDTLIDVPCIHGNTFLQTVLQFPRLWNPCNVVSFVRWLIYRNCSLQHLKAEKGQSSYNDLSLDEFSPSERHELRRLLYLSGAPQEEIIATVNFQVEDEAEDKFDSRRKFKTLCFNLQSKCIRFLRQLFGTGIKEKLSELEISHLHSSPLLQDIIAVSTRIKEEQKRIPDELMRLLLLDDDANDNNSLGTRVKEKMLRLQLPENILLGEFNYVDDESEYCAYTVVKNRETEGRKYEYKVNMMF